MFTLPKKNYEAFAKIDLFSRETIDTHVYQHQLTYINNLNELLKENEYAAKISLEEIILTTNKLNVFNNAAQLWNHSFFWNCINLKPNQSSFPFKILKEIDDHFGSMDAFKGEFLKIACALFGSGWTWLIKNLEDDRLHIVNSNNATPPFKTSDKYIPLLVCDVWEHAYYIDYHSDRATYVKTFLNNVDWDWVNKCLSEEIIQPLGVKE